MLYQLYQAQLDMARPARYLSSLAGEFVKWLPEEARSFEPIRHLSAASDVIASLAITHERPDFGIGSVHVDGTMISVTEEITLDSDFCALLHFKKAEAPKKQPRILLLSPMAGHFATLLRDTIRTLLPEHDVYVTDWKNARDVPLSCGAFSLDHYIDYLMLFLGHLGEGTHVVAVCQPCPAALATASLMAEDDHPATPASLTLIAGPIDTRINPTEVNKLATSRSLDWFERTVINRVPLRYRGSRRKVYPGFLQISGFLGMNLSKHESSWRKLYEARAADRSAVADPIAAFYREYLAVCDLPAEFYLQTIDRIFQRHLLPQGLFEWRGRRVQTRAIHRTPILVVEGGRDDICGRGQTAAALALCEGLPSSKRAEHLESEAGHFGVFAGRRWEQSIYPKLRNWIASSQA